MRHKEFGKNMQTYLKITLAALTTLLLAGCDGDTQKLSTQDPDFAYELDTWIENSEIYEFTPKASPDQACIMLMLDGGNAMAMDCFPKGNIGKKQSLLDPDYMYELDTWVENSELYEFTPRSNTAYSCIMYMLDSGNDMDLKCRLKTAHVIETPTEPEPAE
ncbi:hypothetical protein [Motiliproteus sp. MSK22-1]|uniref:hypothetical protein n=1 Tax=Motiliproteus sp. MSK22-1 TaxID=1897630 RepID=UPI000977DB68|nr:hypothetical protein [Motiliproteus sp. MSK22-1]OMH36200.1 hypothetical protein BGP75_10185 [Motiliproteus sp. MSK22-1]